MSLIVIDSGEILRVAKENPDALKGLVKLFPDVFKPIVPELGSHYVRGASLFVVSMIAQPPIRYALIDIKTGVRFTEGVIDSSLIFGSAERDFKKCTVDWSSISYLEIPK